MAYLVSWCYGHLAGLADAGTYDERYAKWKLEDLPILPSPFRFLIAPDKQAQFDILRTLMNREDVTEVINACDAGREGELIFRTVYYLADCQKPMKPAQRFYTRNPHRKLYHLRHRRKSRSRIIVFHFLIRPSPHTWRNSAGIPSRICTRYPKTGPWSCWKRMW